MVSDIGTGNSVKAVKLDDALVRKLSQLDHVTVVSPQLDLYNLTLGLSAAIMAVGTVLCLTISGSLIGLFSSNPETIAIGTTALRIICLGFVVSAVSTTSSGALEGLGKGVPSLVISLCRYVIFIMPLAWLLCRQLGPTGVWHAFWVTEVLSAVIAFAVYRKSVTRN